MWGRCGRHHPGGCLPPYPPRQDSSPGADHHYEHISSAGSGEPAHGGAWDRGGGAHGARYDGRPGDDDDSPTDDDDGHNRTAWNHGAAAYHGYHGAALVYDHDLPPDSLCNGHLSRKRESQLTIDKVQAISFLVGTVIPILTALLTKVHASSGLKGVVNALMSAVAGSLITVLGADPVVWQTLIWAIGTTWVSSIGTYYGLLKPNQLTGKVALATPQFGIGGPPKTGG
jgi:hypothetical protein